MSNAVKDQWDNTHLCGNYTDDAHCTFLLTSETDTVLNGKKLDMYCAYCTSENKIRKINSLSFWTGLSPKFCPKRKALEKQKSMCDDCANNNGSCLKPTEGKCVRYVSTIHLDELLFLAKHAGYKASVNNFLDKFLQKYPNFDANRFEELKPFLKTEEINKTTPPTYFDVFLQHYPHFDVDRFDEFVTNDVCAAECFDDAEGILGSTSGKHNTACTISCIDCWKSECKLQWKLFEGIETYIEPYLKTAGKEEDNMARKMEFDAAITEDMKSAASDSFMDNIKMIDITEIEPSSDNFYEISDVELLADDIEREGLKHNLVVAKSRETGLYEVKSGHRRLAAIKLLIGEKRRKSTKIPCYVDGEKTSAESKFDLIMLNATQRKYTDADKMHEYEELEKTFKALADAGKPLKGRMRENIAAAMHISSGQVQKIDNIKRNALPEVEKAVKSGEMSISTANELAKLSEEKQREIVNQKPDISNKELKELQREEKPKKLKPTERLDEFDEVPHKSDRDIEVKTEKKNSPPSSHQRAFVLNKAEASVLLAFLDEWAEGEEEVSEILSRLKEFCKEM